ncbi:MAG: PIN domain-containing protein [bacterium]
MRVLVDTSIWSLAFRRNKNISIEEAGLIKELVRIIQEMKAAIIGPIRQELLSGISAPEQYKTLRDKLRAFEDMPIDSDDYEVAADFFNRCRKKGIQGSHIDFLICAVACRNNMPLFTLDKDFELYSRHVEVSLYIPNPPKDRSSS